MSTRRQLVAVILVLTVLMGPAALVSHVHEPGHEGPDCVVCVLLAGFVATLPALLFVPVAPSRRLRLALQPVACAPSLLARSISPRAPPV